MGWIDSAIAAVAPRTALRRAQARRALRYLDGAGRNPLDFDRNTGRVADALPLPMFKRKRIRSLLQTNPYARKAMSTLLNNLVAYGITGAPKKGTPAKVGRSWRRWMKKADWQGLHDFYGLQSLAVGTMLADGESFIIRRFERDGDLVPLKLQVLGPAMIADWKGENGIEYDDRGRPVRYWFRRSDKLWGLNDTVDFPAADVIHLFDQEFPEQRRGHSFFEPALKRWEDIDAYLEAEVVRKQIEACFAAFITPSLEADDTGPGIRDGSTSGAGFDLETLEPGMIRRGAPGEEITFGDPRPSGNMIEFLRGQMLGASAGVCIPYEHASGDLSNVNYSSYKAGGIEFQRFCGRKQWLTIIPRMLDSIWQWFCEAGYQTGQLGSADYEIDWMPAEFESIDLQRDVRGQVAQLAAGLTTRRRLYQARGWDWDEDLETIRNDLKAQGDLVFEGDPTRLAPVTGG